VHVDHCVSTSDPSAKQVLSVMFLRRISHLSPSDIDSLLSRHEEVKTV